MTEAYLEDYRQIGWIRCAGIFGVDFGDLHYDIYGWRIDPCDPAVFWTKCHSDLGWLRGAEVL
jgi:hypothetical protein